MQVQTFLIVRLEYSYQYELNGPNYFCNKSNLNFLKHIFYSSFIAELETSLQLSSINFFFFFHVKLWALRLCLFLKKIWAMHADCWLYFKSNSQVKVVGIFYSLEKSVCSNQTGCNWTGPLKFWSLKPGSHRMGRIWFYLFSMSLFLLEARR